MEQDKIRKLLKTGGFKALEDFKSEEITRSLILILEAYQKAVEPADFDRLLSIGITAAKSEKKGAGDGVLEWLTAAPSSKKLDIASAFLTGFWDRRYRRRPVLERHISLLASQKEMAVHDDDTMYSFVQALSQGAGSTPDESAKHLIFAVLKEINCRKYSGIIGNLIKDLITDTLNN